MIDSPVTLFKALGDDTRLRVMLLLQAEGELCVCEMTCALDLSQPKISRHLAQLRNTGLITDSRQGQWVYYRLNSELPNWCSHILAETQSANISWLEQDRARLQAMGDRPARLASNCCS